MKRLLLALPLLLAMLVSAAPAHAQITETEGGWLLRDLSSENGTYVNGQRVTERLLADGDRVQFGTSRFVLRLHS